MCTALNYGRNCQTSGRIGGQGAQLLPSVSQLIASDTPAANYLLLASAICVSESKELDRTIKQLLQLIQEGHIWRSENGANLQQQRPFQICPYKQALMAGQNKSIPARFDSGPVAIPPNPPNFLPEMHHPIQAPWGPTNSQKPFSKPPLHIQPPVVKLLPINAAQIGCPPVHHVQTVADFKAVAQLVQGRTKLSLSCQGPAADQSCWHGIKPSTCAAITLYAPPCKALSQGPTAILIDWQEMGIEDRAAIASLLRPILEDKGIQKVVHDVTLLSPWLDSADINISPLWDTQIAFGLVRLVESGQPESASDMLGLKLDLPSLLEQIGRPTVSIPSASQSQKGYIGGAGYTNWLTIASQIRESCGHSAWRERPLTPFLTKIAALE
eukprot:scaffold178495_cov51-Prasinocladus_malaysianus.AAC.1